MSFSFEATLPEYREAYRTLLKRGLVEYTQFKQKRKAESSKKLFDAWWLIGGPVNFKSNEDALRYKKELWEFITGLTNESEEATISTNQS